MRIIFRHSSGRGEYEVAGEASGYTAADITDKNIVIRLAPDWIIRTGLVNRLKNGKRRVRSEPPGEFLGIQRQMCTALLLNPTVRSQAQVDSGGHLFEYLEANQVEVNQNDAVFYAEFIVISDKTAEATINVHHRVQEVKHLWQYVNQLPSYLGDIIQKHQIGVTYGGPILKSTEKLCRNIPQSLSAEEEAIEIIKGTGDLLPGIQSLTNIPITKPLFDVEQIPVQETELKRRTIEAWRRWQQTNVRGASGRKFSRDVRAAYDSTCFVCGIRLPGSDGHAPGVDAAHILPWREYEADEVNNGICLCKNHHWAFDAGLLAINGGDISNKYVVYVPETAKTTLWTMGEIGMITWLESFCGAVPPERLPHDVLQYPKREYFEILARQMEI